MSSRRYKACLHSCLLATSSLTLQKRQRRDPARPAKIDIRRQAIGGRQNTQSVLPRIFRTRVISLLTYPRRLQYSEGEHTAFGPEIARRTVEYEESRGHEWVLGVSIWGAFGAAWHETHLPGTARQQN